MADCFKCCLPGSQVPPYLQFTNSQGSASGDSKIPHNRRLLLGIIFPQETGVQPMYMYFNRTSEGVKVLEAACAAAGVKLDKGRIMGSPERLNLFTIEGDLLRIDLELEAHLGSTLQPGGWVILEKGNRLAPERLAAIQEAAQLAAEAGPCIVM